MDSTGSTLLVYWPLKVLYNTCQHFHTNGKGTKTECQPANQTQTHKLTHTPLEQPSGAICGSAFCPRTLRHAAGGAEPQLPHFDVEMLYIMPFNMICCMWVNVIPRLFSSEPSYFHELWENITPFWSVQCKKACKIVVK